MPTDPQTGERLPYPGEGGGAFSGAVQNARAGADAALGPEPPATVDLSPQAQEVADLVDDPGIPKQEKLARIAQILDEKERSAGPAGPAMGPPPGGPPMGPPPGGPPPGGPPMGLPPGPMGGM